MSCYVTGKNELKFGCPNKALLCFENCRKMAEEEISKNPVYAHTLMRSARKECQLLQENGLFRRAYKVLAKVEKHIEYSEASTEKLLIYSMLYSLSSKFAPSHKEDFEAKLNKIVTKLDS